MRSKADEATFAGMTYGVEIETEGLKRKLAAEVVRSVTGGTVVYEGTSYDTWTCVAPDGRKWKCMSDGSLADVNAEVVTPVLTIEDMPTLQEVVRALRRAGAMVSHRCGSHVHVGAKDMTAAQIKNLVKLFYKNEELIYKMFKVQAHRLSHYTARIDRNFIGKICDMPNPTFDKIKLEWFWGDYHGATPPAVTHHYTNCRYHALNLCNLWDDDHGSAKHTVEFRLFEGTLHAGQIRANVIFALLMVKKATEAKAGSIRNRYEFNPACAKFYARVFLQNIGFIGTYTKNPREHLMGHLGGSSRTVWTGRRTDIGEAA